MSTDEQKVHEARLVAVSRAIQTLARPGLVGRADVGYVLAALEEIVDLDQKQDELSSKELRQLIEGFVAGFAIANVQEAEPEYLPFDGYFQNPDPQEGVFEGGPSGGTAIQQGNDPNFITQTGVRKGEDK